MLKAIETEYNGNLFRSRLEARWAVFFNALDIKYHYEIEGFDLNGEGYLPDFYLPDINSGIVAREDHISNKGIWLEIKPTREKVKEEESKLSKFGSVMTHNFFIICGLPHSGEYEILSFARTEIFIQLKLFPYWIYCEDCDKYTLGWIGKLPYPNVAYCGNCLSFATCDTPGEFCTKFTCTPQMFNAWNTAKQARFGKNGRG